ncbi:class A beta-lactamase [Phyllobacterium sp. P30BS-XVII]|uniref:class A beta-lactamase n=1 Tax=Phyllobacterium sp. P30BS-XVII TaxID=2587046 RepID=UPI000DD521F1|nr:class A beta-lactamase [Phyllobacterium sp. P30BS-XVII]MBA8902359.1 beta-lactamase class A [Phyllobacterium sp. P30BS-XVII]
MKPFALAIAAVSALGISHVSYAGGIADPAALQQRLEKLATGKDARIGICALDQAGTSVCVRGDERFSLQSVVKLIAGAATLDAADHGAVNIEDPIIIRSENLSLMKQPLAKIVERNGFFRTNAGDLVRRAIIDSDSAAVDILINRLGGTGKINSFLAGKAISGIRIDRDERHLQTDIVGLQWKQEYVDAKVLQRAIKAVPEVERDTAFDAYQKDPRDTATPRAMTEFLAALMSGKLISTSSTDRLLAIMNETSTFPDRLRAGVGNDWSVAHKTGTSPTWKGVNVATNDVGILTAPDGGKVAISVFVADSRETPTRRATIIASAAQAVTEAYR